MRILLRLFALYTAGSVVATVFLIVRITLRGGLPYLLRDGSFGVLTITGWIATLAIGPPAALLLWRRKRTGLVLGFAMWASVCIYYVCEAVFWHGRAGVPIAGSGLLAIILMTPAARRACEHLSDSQLKTNNLQPTTKSQSTPEDSDTDCRCCSQSPHPCCPVCATVPSTPHPLQRPPTSTSVLQCLQRSACRSGWASVFPPASPQRTPVSALCAQKCNLRLVEHRHLPRMCRLARALIRP